MVHFLVPKVHNCAEFLFDICNCKLSQRGQIFQNKVTYTQYLVDPDYLLNAQVRVTNFKIFEARQIFRKIFQKVSICVQHENPQP